MQVTTTLQVPFHDVDMMTIAWHGHYVKYFEIARCELLNAIGYNYLDMHASGYSWPVIDLRLKFIKPARFGMTIAVSATLKEVENRLKIDYLIVDQATGERLTKGYTVQVAVALDSGEMCFASPPVLLEKLQCANVKL